MADILVIDDDDDLGDTLRAMLEGAGHTVYEARNGLEGVACCQTHSIARNRSGSANLTLAI